MIFAKFLLAVLLITGLLLGLASPAFLPSS
jgi:hypothetical protein